MSPTINLSTETHRRFNPLTGDWVLVSPNRTQRPWYGQKESVADERPAYDPKCYLCPGNARANGEKNPSYQGTHVFTNDFAAMSPAASSTRDSDDPLFRAHPVGGACRVICFSPRHDLTMAEMSEAEIRGVVDTWRDQAGELGRTYRWVQIFENKGAVMGCSNPHPHGQLWASDFLPNEASKEDAGQRAYFERNGSPMLIDYARRELDVGDRVVVANACWVAVVPYWALWPFEILLLPVSSARAMTELSPEARDALAAILKSVLTRYDNLFETSFPYSMGWHGSPHDSRDHRHWQLHAHFYPPLLRSASVKKFMVGYEMLASPQRDLTPEEAAAKLRGLSEAHFRAGRQRKVFGSDSDLDR